MTELKTLDDFPQSWRCPNCEAHEKPRCVQVHDLRAEAVKWVEKMEEVRERNKELVGYYVYDVQAPKKAFMEFFNLTEEGLR